MEFVTHCWQVRHYSFSIKKCGSLDCHICKPPKLPTEKFRKQSHIQDPVPGTDGHYLPFTEVFGINTNESHCSTLQKCVKKNSLLFIASVQHANNTGLVVQCEECEMWRLVYEPRKHKLSECFEDYTFTCGSNLSDLQLTDNLRGVCVKYLNCYDAVKKLYFSVKNYEATCIYCLSMENLIVTTDTYPTIQRSL